MIKRLKTQNISVAVNTDTGIVEELIFLGDKDQMNWLISSATLVKYGYKENAGCLLGKSVLHVNGQEVDTGLMSPSGVEFNKKEIVFIYMTRNVEVRHKFAVKSDKFFWSVRVSNLSNSKITIKQMYHWLPVAYVMHESIDENLRQSCAFVPSVAGDHSHIICRKRNGSGPDMLIVNDGGRMMSTGSLCKFRNLFFEKSAPSLSGLVIHNVVNVGMHADDVDPGPAVDWPYREMYNELRIPVNGRFYDSYTFMPNKPTHLKRSMKKARLAVVNYPSAVLLNQVAEVKIDYAHPVERCEIFTASSEGEHLEPDISIDTEKRTGHLHIGPFLTPGERKLIMRFADGTHTFVLFAVYESMRGIVEAFCSEVFANRFIDDPKSSDYCAYQSVSRQGESCAKGSLLLLKNLLTPAVAEEIRQVEKNTVHYLKKRWLHDDFTAIKQYPGGFARIIDMDYLIMQFYLLSLFDDEFLDLHSGDEYLVWAYKTTVYRMTVTPDKLLREIVETEMASNISWLMIEMIERLEARGFHEKAGHLKALWADHTALQVRKVHNKTFVETEHYFDNAGISVVSEILLNSGETEAGLEAASLLLPNIAASNDYRNIAPDRWWEALAFMYHNLWAVFSAKAMLTAYEASKDNRFLFSAYKSMIPMFFNYDWNAVSAKKLLKKGEGVSAYCITNPNLNLLDASRNRFGQSIFQDEFFSDIDVSGDDWDLGADMIVYLMTFGQKTFVTMEEGGPVCVNGKLSGSLDNMHIESNAAYPAEYFIEPFKITIKRGSNNFLLKWIVFQKKKCVKAGIEKLKTTSDNDIVILSKKGPVESRVFPELVIL